MIPIKSLHTWNLTPQEAIVLQKELAQHILTDDCVQNVSFIAGADVALEGNDNIHAAVVIMSYPELQIVEMRCHKQTLTMPYIPGLLSFREVPVLLNTFAKIEQKPDLILVDGMGIAHPRGIGIASHLGLWLNIPTIGVGKKKLIGDYSADHLSNEKGSSVALMYHEKMIGAVVRTKNNVKPLFISSGHMISLKTSVEYVLRCTTKYRLPEPTRCADLLSKQDVRLHKKCV